MNYSPYFFTLPGLSEIHTVASRFSWDVSKLYDTNIRHFGINVVAREWRLFGDLSVNLCFGGNLELSSSLALRAETLLRAK